MTVLNDRDDAMDHEQEEASPSPKGGDGDDLGMSDQEADEKARALGWVPEAEWDNERAEREGRRKPATFVTARQFIAKAEDSLPILRDQLRRTLTELTEVKKQNTEIYGVLSEQRKLSAAAIERAKVEERQKIEREREQAVAEGDVAAFKAADAKLADMDKDPEPEPAPGAAAPAGAQSARAEDPEITAFKTANADWFTKDPRLTNNMIDEFGEIQRYHPNLSMREQLAKAKEKIVDRFPEKFGINKRREGARPGVTPPTGSRDAGSVERRFAGLTNEERAAWDRVSKLVLSRGGTITKAEYLNEIGR